MFKLLARRAVRPLCIAASLFLVACEDSTPASSDPDVPAADTEVAPSDTATTEASTEAIDGVETASPCTPGATQVLVPALDGPQRLTADAAHLYWVDDHGIWRSDLSGADKVSLATDQDIRVLVVDDVWCYFGTFGGEIRRVSKTPGGTSEHFAGDAGHKVSNPTALAVDATHLYWTDAYFDSISRVSLDGTTTTTLIESKTQGGIVGDEPHRLALNSTKLFWTTLDGQVGFALKDGSGATALVAPAAEFGGIAADDTHIYWVGDGVYRATIDGSAVLQLAPANPSRRYAIVIDATDAYFLGRNQFGIVPKLGGALVELRYPSDRPSLATDLIVRDSAIFWSHDPGSDGDGAILRTCLP